MARRTSKHSSHKKKIPLLATAGVAGTALYVAEAYKNGGSKSAMHALTGMTTDGTFVMHDAIVTYTPAIVGVIGSAVASKLHINRYMSGVPVFKF